MHSRAWRFGLAGAVLVTGVVITAIIESSSQPARATGPVASGSGTGFTSQIISIPSTATYDFNYHLKSAAGYCAEGPFSPPTPTYESATVDLVSSANVTAIHISTGPLVAWEVPGQSLSEIGDQEVSLAAGNWTLRISWTCFNGGALASSWSYSIS